MGYLPLSVMLVAISIYVLYNIGGVNRLSKSIVENDIEILAASEKLSNILLGQEAYGQRYIILESDELLGIFRKRGKEFKEILTQLNRLPEKPAEELEKLAQVHENYIRIYETFFNEENHSIALFREKYGDEAKSEFNLMMETVSGVAAKIRMRRDNRMRDVGVIGYRTFWITAVLTFAGLVLGFLTAFIITRNISTSVKKLKVATDQIAEGNFTYTLRLNRNDELGDLAGSFSVMAKRLSRWEEMYLDASPLTRLPGGVAIDNVLKKRLESGRQIAFCLIDLDNFKSFNDKYGYAMGNIVIKTAAGIIEKSILHLGANDDFVGHIGGDDFAVISKPERVAAICDYIVSEFDKTIPEFYEEADRSNGCIEGKNRQGDIVQFPIMTVSIAVVTNDKNKNLNHIEIGEIAAELKEHAKMIPGSNFISDRRNRDVVN